MGFWKDEGGAVATDWMALTGALVGMAVVIIGSLSDGLSTASTTTGTALAATQVSALGTLGWSD